MATHTIPAETTICKGKASASCEAAWAFEELASEAERIASTSYLLAASQVVDEGAQDAFYALADLATRLKAKAKEKEARFALQSGKGSAQ